MLFLSFSFFPFHPLSNVVLLCVLYYPVYVYGNIIGVVMLLKKFLMRYNYFLSSDYTFTDVDAHSFRKILLLLLLHSSYFFLIFYYEKFVQTIRTHSILPPPPVYDHDHVPTTPLHNMLCLK